MPALIQFSVQFSIPTDIYLKHKDTLDKIIAETDAIKASKLAEIEAAKAAKRETKIAEREAKAAAKRATKPGLNRSKGLPNLVDRVLAEDIIKGDEDDCVFVDDIQNWVFILSQHVGWPFPKKGLGWQKIIWALPKNMVVENGPLGGAIFGLLPKCNARRPEHHEVKAKHLAERLAEAASPNLEATQS